MARSMTGFGSGTARAEGWRAEVTIRTLNHRFLSVRTRSLSDRPRLQAQIEERVKGAIARGEVGVWLDLQPDEAADHQLFDHGAARATFNELVQLSEELSISTPPTLEALIRLGRLQPAVESDEAVWPAVSAALDDALQATVRAREAEGASLATDLARLLDRLREFTESIADRVPEILASLRDRLRERVAELEANVDPARLETEVALLADRCDVQEELVRLRGHIDRASALLAGSEPIGKELDFIGQELLREVNTIGSKARDSLAAGTVIDMKLCVEQFREQVQNVE